MITTARRHICAALLLISAAPAFAQDSKPDIPASSPNPATPAAPKKTPAAADLAAAQETLKGFDREKEPRKWLETAVTVIRMLHKLGRHSETKTLCVEIMFTVGEQYGPKSLETARVMELVAEIRAATGVVGNAEMLYREALSIMESALGKDHPDLSGPLFRLAALIQNRQGAAHAEPLLRRALAIDEAALGKVHRQVAIRLSDLAQVLNNTGRTAEAEPLFRRAIAIHQAASAANDLALAVCLNNFGLLLQKSERVDEAETHFRKALAIDEAADRKDDPAVARDLASLGLLLHDKKRYAEAEPLLRRSLEIIARASATSGRPHPYLKPSIESYTVHLQETGSTHQQADEKIAKILEPIFKK